MSNRFTATVLAAVMTVVCSAVCMGQDRTPKGVPVEMDKAMFLSRIADYKNSPNEFKYLGDKPSVIDFHATWCGPCKKMAPAIDELAREYKNKIHVYKIDVDKEPEIAALFGIQSVPTLIFIPMSGKISGSVGAMSLDGLRNTVDTVLLEK